MKKQKLTLSLLILLLVLNLFSGRPALAAGNGVPSTVDEVIQKINQDMVILYGVGQEYYKPYITKGGSSLYIRKDLIQDRLHRSPTGKITDDYNIRSYEIVYGGDHGANLNHKGKQMREYSGYSRDGQSVGTEEAPWFAGWSGTQIQDFKMIEAPWKDGRVQRKYNISITRFDAYRDTNHRNKFLADGTFEQSIITGLTTVFGNGRTYKDFMYNTQNSNLADRPVYENDSSPSRGGRWVDYVHVLQPPTEYSWGFGTIYIDSNIGITYLGIPLAPFSLQSNDISAKFDTLPKEALVGELVRVGISVSSSFPDQVNPEFKWKITAGGRTLTADDGLKFVGHATTSSGNISLTKNQSKVLYAEFNMPRNQVQIQFSVNEEGKDPEESLLKNNTLNSSPKAVQVLMPVELGYDVLSIRDQFTLKNNPLVAQLSLPFSGAYWTGNATGMLNVNNDQPDLFRHHTVMDNPAVNEASENITRSPIFKASIKRDDFGDDPVNRQWKNLASPDKPIRREGTVSYEGSVSRPWEYKYEQCVPQEDGTQECTTITENGTEDASFETAGFDRKPYDVFVYNGSNSWKKKTYEKKIDSNTSSSLNKTMYWENEPYIYNVIRWMYHLDENGQPYVPGGITPDAKDNGIAVPGQYPRDFTQQASAKIKWSVESKMSDEYKTARQAAKDGKNNKKLYDKAVFPTDKELQKYAYPIKSGYYFNPAGSYTFNVETVTYKQSEADTKDHKDLVDYLIQSFRYENNLIYINNKKKAVNIANQELDAKGGGFKVEPGILTAENPKGVNGDVLLEVLDRSKESSRYTKKVEPITFSMQKDGDTHDYWKMVLEGYGLSSTADSFAKYKYREYVKNGEKSMYKITETTRVTIQINPNNLPVYTHANMQDGNYYVKAWLEDINFGKGSKSHAYEQQLSLLKGHDALDKINITVKGSMFDDLNN